MAAKASFFTSWVVFTEGWLFGHYLNWWWAVVWMFSWFVAGRLLLLGIKIGQKSKEIPDA